MFNYYLYNNSYENATVDDLELNLKVLNAIAVDEKRDYDSFLMHQSLWSVNTSVGAFGDIIFSQLPDQQFSIQIIPRLLQFINNIENPINSLDEFDQLYRLYNAFYGISFREVENSRHINSKERYQEFQDNSLKTINAESLWGHRDTIFKRTVLCPQVEKDLGKIGETYTAQILARLLELDRYVTDLWEAGEFDYRDANKKTSLRMSPESDKTMSQDKLRKMRNFKMPDGTIECFELHIKTGDLRFHFFPKDKTVFIGYIGPHLKTADN